jgi:hypothetical protein
MEKPIQSVLICMVSSVVYSLKFTVVCVCVCVCVRARCCCCSCHFPLE